jgi:transcription antitermination protein NusB
MTAGPRHQAREAALQILYFCQIAAVLPDEAQAAFFAEHAPDAAEAVRSFAHQLVVGVIEQAPALDALIEQHSAHWRLERLALIDRLILRMGAWELQHALDTPPAVVLDEAVELARTFSTDDSVRFVNGVLDAIRKTLEGVRPQGPGHSGDQ